jgi:hypothetical protein
VDASLSINQANLEKPFSRGRVPFHQSGKFGKTLLTWTRPFLSIRQVWKNPSHVDASLSINQANLEKPFSRGRIPFYQSGKFEYPIQKGRSSSYPSTVSQELRMNEEVAKA